MSNTITSVIIASAQSVAKVFVIGGVGYAAVLYPQKAPFMPRTLVGTIARFTFHALTIPLIYSTIAIAVTIESVGNYWFVIVGCFGVLGLSYFIATLLKQLIPIANPQDFCALRIAATFPNIVALPILIFPSLCEFSVVHEGYIPHTDDDNAQDLERQCVAQSTTMIFCYFFSWSLAFWSFGNPQLMRAAKQRQSTHNNNNNNNNSNSSEITKSQGNDGLVQTCHTEEPPSILESSALAQQPPESNQIGGGGDAISQDGSSSDGKTEAHHQDITEEESEEELSVAKTVWLAIKQTTTSPGFIAMVLAFLTACIPPLQKALFEPAGPLRFLGSAVETLGSASSPISTIVVAASLVPPRPAHAHTEDDDDNEEDDTPIIDENPGMTDPNFGPYRRRQHRRPSRFQSFRRSVRSSSIRMLQAVPPSSPELRRLHIWFCLSRLVVTPAVVVGLIVALDCGGGWLDQVPNLAKLVIIINSALPGALIVIVLLKSNEELSETASAVAKVYFPSYLLSIFSIAAWASVGLWVTLPDEDGNTVCQRL